MFKKRSKPLEPVIEYEEHGDKSDSDVENVTEQLENTVVFNRRKQHNLGLTPAAALKHFSHHFSPSEKKEIFKYSNIYAIPTNLEGIATREKAFHRGNFGYEGFRPNSGDHIDYRYHVEDDEYSSDVKVATDMKNNQKVSIRIINYRLHAPREIKTLQRIADIGEDHRSNFVHILDVGFFRRREYIVSEYYQSDLKKYLDVKYPDGMSLEKIGPMARSILHGLDYLQEHDIIHADLKPQNIYLNINNPEALKIGGFGMAIRSGDYHTELQTQEYRAPEVFCKGAWTPALDMWSFGCIIAEMYKNKYLIKGNNTEDQFWAIVELLNIPPVEFKETHNLQIYFFGTLDRVPKYIASCGGKYVVNYSCFPLVAPHRQLPGTKPLKSLFPKPEEQHLLNFLQRVVRWMSNKRLVPAHALNHPFFGPTPIWTPEHPPYGKDRRKKVLPPLD